MITYDDEKLLEAYKLCDKMFLSKGITSVHDAGAYGGQFVKVLQTACMNRDVHIRVYEMIYRMLGKHFFQALFILQFQDGTGGIDHLMSWF